MSHEWDAPAAGGVKTADGISQGDPSLPESEAGTGIIPGEDSGPADDTHLPASEADSPQLEEDEGSPAQSWPGGGGPGTIPPPG